MEVITKRYHILNQSVSLVVSVNICDSDYLSDLTTGAYIIAFGKEGVSNNSTKFIVK